MRKFFTGIWQGIVYAGKYLVSIWIVLFFGALFICDILIIAFMEKSIGKDILLSIVSILVGVTGISLTDYRKRFKEKRAIQKTQKEILGRFNGYFKQKLGYSLSRECLQEETVEAEILRRSIIAHLGAATPMSKVNALILCYYCKKWEVSKDPGDYQLIKVQSENLSIKYGEITAEVHSFLDDYASLILDGRNGSTDAEILGRFTENHYKDLQFFEIREELYQSKNLHETLVRIIQDGKLSTYGINRDTLEKLRNDLQANYMRQNTYLILLSNATEQIKDYLRGLPGISGFRGRLRNIEGQGNLGYSGFIVRPAQVNSPEEFLEILKSKLSHEDESVIVRIIPLDFLNSVAYTLPEDQSFTEAYLKDYYEAIEWFRTGFVMEESVLWNEIAKSKISPNELLSLIPFNIFCRGILPCEQAFFIQHYGEIKSQFDVEGLTDWRDKDAGMLRDTLLGYGKPDYSESELANRLEVQEDDDQNEAIGKRILGLCEAIIEGAKGFHKSMQYQD